MVSRSRAGLARRPGRAAKMALCGAIAPGGDPCRAGQTVKPFGPNGLRAPTPGTLAKKESLSISLASPRPAREKRAGNDPLPVGLQGGAGALVDPATVARPATPETPMAGHHCARAPRAPTSSGKSPRCAAPHVGTGQRWPTSATPPVARRIAACRVAPWVACPCRWRRTRAARPALPGVR